MYEVQKIKFTHVCSNWCMPAKCYNMPACIRNLPLDSCLTCAKNAANSRLRTSTVPLEPKAGKVFDAALRASYE